MLFCCCFRIDCDACKVYMNFRKSRSHLIHLGVMTKQCDFDLAIGWATYRSYLHSHTAPHTDKNKCIPSGLALKIEASSDRTETTAAVVERNRRHLLLSTTSYRLQSLSVIEYIISRFIFIFELDKFLYFFFCCFRSVYSTRLA